MRLWSIHPGYLDVKGLVALWRESLLAQKVLKGNTIGYKNHPQLIRFKNASDPIDAISTYLLSIYYEGKKRGYNFDLSKIDSSRINKRIKIKVSNKQIDFEFDHLKRKIRSRDKKKYDEIRKIKTPKHNPIF
jgi:hypothetical protein